MAQTSRLRESILPLLGTADHAMSVVEDAAAWIDSKNVVRFEEIVEKNDTWACFYGHASTCCCRPPGA